MTRNQRIVVGGLLVLAVAVSTYAFQRDGRPARTSESAYRVTPWPVDSEEQGYDRAIERHLNEMAADGWRLHSTMVGQRAKVMIFERGS